MLNRTSLDFLNHVKITVGNFDRSKKFYDKLFGFLRVKKNFEAEEDSAWGGRVIGWGTGSYDFEIQEGAARLTKLKFDRERVGLDHIAFSAKSKKAVIEFYEKFLLKNRIRCWKPREYPEYAKGYYAVFFLDPDGMILEYAFTP